MMDVCNDIQDMHIVDCAGKIEKQKVRLIAVEIQLHLVECFSEAGLHDCIGAFASLFFKFIRHL